MRGVPSGNQVAEGAYALIKAVPRANSRRVQEWIGDPRTQRIFTRLINMGPDWVDQITHDIPPMEVIRFKAELLGKTEMFGEVNLPADASGWMFNTTTVMDYVEALRELVIMAQRETFGSDVGDRCSSIHVAGNSVMYSGATFFDPLQVITTRKIPPYNPPFANRIGGGGIFGLIDILDHALNHAVRATLLCSNVVEEVLAAFYAKPGKNASPVCFSINNAYTEGADWPRESWKARKIVPYLNLDRVALRQGHKCLGVYTVDHLEYKELKLETIYTQFVCKVPLEELAPVTETEVP